MILGGQGAASQFQNPSISILSEHIKRRFCHVRKERASDLILGPRGIDFDLFCSGGMVGRLPHDLAMVIDNQIRGFALGTEIMVAGVDDNGAHTYSIDDPGKMACFDRLGYHSIGVGNRHALLKLVSLRQHHSKSVEETIFNVFCAKRVAELASGVGQATTMKIVTREQTTAIEQSKLDFLATLYDEVSESDNNLSAKAIEILALVSEGDGHGTPIQKDSS